MKRSKSRKKVRANRTAQSLVVEQLEGRRLLSASSHSLDFFRHEGHHSFDEHRDRRPTQQIQRAHAERNSQNHSRPNNQINKNRPPKRTPPRRNLDRVPLPKQIQRVSAPAVFPSALWAQPALVAQQGNTNQSVTSNPPPIRPDRVTLDGTAGLGTRSNALSTTPIRDAKTTLPKVEPPRPSQASTNTKEVVSLAPSQQRTAQPVGVAQQRPAISFDAAFALAGNSFESFDFGEEDEKPIEHDTTMPLNRQALGGEIDLSKIPELADTLPAVIEETTPLINLGESEEANTTDESPNKLGESSEQKQKANSQPSEPDSTTATPPTSQSSPHDLADAIFADADETETFGGELEMPEPLPYADDTANVAFDSLVPAPPRIDQIISQPLMMEVADQSEQEEDNTTQKPLSINLRAGVPLVTLCVPAAILRAAKDKREQMDIAHRRKSGGLRYSS